MRNTRPLATLTALAALTLCAAVLSGCAPQSQEEQAKAMFMDVIKASTDGGDLHFCPGSEPTKPQPSKLNDGATLGIEKGDSAVNTQIQYTVFAPVSPLHGEKQTRGSSVQVRFSDGEEPCYVSIISYVW